MERPDPGIPIEYIVQTMPLQMRTQEVYDKCALWDTDPVAILSEAEQILVEKVLEKEQCK